MNHIRLGFHRDSRAGLLQRGPTGQLLFIMASTAPKKYS